MKNDHQSVFDKAAECRIFLRVHGFLSDKENNNVWKRIDKYGSIFDVNKFKIHKPVK